MTGQNKDDDIKQIKGLLNENDALEISARVQLQGLDSKEHYLALIKHKTSPENTSSATETCLVLFIKDIFLTPTEVLSILKGTKADVSQMNQIDKKAQPSLLLTIAEKEKKLQVIFNDKDVMPTFLSKLRESIDNAVSTEDYKWVNFYTSTKKIKKPIRKQTTSSTSSKSSNHSKANAISHVLPLQRAQTIADFQLRRNKTVSSSIRRPIIESSHAKEHWINARLKDQEGEFVNWQNSKIFVGTWNVHGSLPTESLSTWLLGTSKDSNGNVIDPDFYVIGLQEMETNAEAYLYYDATKENTWVDAVLNSLGGKKHNYYKVASLQLVTVLIIVVARTEHQPFITEVDTRYCGVGIMNRLGNKGGCSVRFRFHDSYFCFVASHLAAFVSNCDRRNQDFTEICKKILFNHQIDKKTEYVHHSWNSGGDEGVTFLDRNGVTNDWSKQASIFHADHVIWLGDLNYRVNLTRTEVNAKLNQDEYQDLLEYDQLSIERQAGRAFSMFEEGPINFFPTYRYDAGTNQYDTSPKKRVPSWTDRILWKKPMDHNKPTLTQLSYDDCMEMMLSDHKPVQALFDIKVRDINVEKQSETKQKLIQQLIETPDDITKGTLSSSYVSFDDVQFMEFKERNLILENTGKAVAPFRFIPKMDEPQVCPNWLQVYPLQGVIGPGEKVVLHFEIMIDSSMSAPFNEGKQEIKDILVLRLENGKDFFIDINGKYIPTCFGMKLDQLAQMTVPIQEVISSSRDQREQSKSSNDPNQNQQQQQLQQQVNLPKELWRMLTFLWNKNMLSMEDLFLCHGDRVISDYIRKCLDSGDTFDTAILLGETSQDINENEDDDSDNEKSKSSESVGANSMVDVLIAFLDCLPEPVIPTSFYSRALAAADSNDLIKALKEDLPYLHLNVLLYITSFLNYAIDYAPESCKEERREHIVTSFTVLLKPGLDFKEKNPALAEQTKQRFISRLLQL